MRIISLIFFMISALPPFWPIGDNPQVGAPYVIVNKLTNQLAFIDDGKIQQIYPVATGKSVELTPEGEFTVTVKAIDPYYRKKNIPGGAPNNPLGSRWIGFDARGTDGRTYGIHGNHQPSSIGSYITEGCIRMYEQDVQELYEHVPLGTKVLIVSSKKSFAELARAHGAIQ